MTNHINISHLWKTCSWKAFSWLVPLWNMGKTIQLLEIPPWSPMTMETPTCLNQIILIIIILIEIVSPVHASLVNYPQSTLLIAPPCSQESCPKRQILPPQVPRGREVIPVGGRKKVTRKTKVSELGVPPIDPNSWWLCTGKSHWKWVRTGGTPIFDDQKWCFTVENPLKADGGVSHGMESSKLCLMLRSTCFKAIYIYILDRPGPMFSESWTSKDHQQPWKDAYKSYPVGIRMCCESLTGWLNFQLFPFDRDFFRVVSGMGSPKSLHVIRASEKKIEPKTLNHAFWRALKRLAQSLFSLPAYFLLQPPLPSAKRACPRLPQCARLLEGTKFTESFRPAKAWQYGSENIGYIEYTQNGNFTGEMAPSHDKPWKNWGLAYF